MFIFFLLFKCLSQAYLVKTSITYNEYLTFQLKKDNGLISPKSAVQILPLNLA